MNSDANKIAHNEGPLSGMRVLELGQMIAVPAATHILAGYGAEVIKVEDTGAGDGLRYFGILRGQVQVPGRISGSDVNRSSEVL